MVGLIFQHTSKCVDHRRNRYFSFAMPFQPTIIVFFTLQFISNLIAMYMPAKGHFLQKPLRTAKKIPRTTLTVLQNKSN